ncbi:MAG: PEP-CTERM sorting domain-containing protein [Burkholderiales bacterium]
MNASRPLRLFCQALLLILGAFALEAGAEVFYGGETKGFPGDPVHLTIHARAGTILEAMDIAPFYDEVAGILDAGNLEVTSAFTDGGVPLCQNEVCGVFFVSPKSFAADALLATISFTIAPGAPVGPVDFDAGVIVDATPLPIPGAQQFQVLAIPEPSNWLLMLFGLAAVAFAVPRCRRAQGSFGARRAAVLRAARRWRVPARSVPSQ